MTRAFLKNIFRTIKDRLAFYLLIIFIVVIGVGFSVGIFHTEARMIDAYTVGSEAEGFHVLRLTSTWGFTPEEVDEIYAFEEVEKAEGKSVFELPIIGEENGIREIYSQVFVYLKPDDSVSEELYDAHIENIKLELLDMIIKLVGQRQGFDADELEAEAEMSAEQRAQLEAGLEELEEELEELEAELDELMAEFEEAWEELEEQFGALVTAELDLDSAQSRFNTSVLDLGRAQTTYVEERADYNTAREELDRDQTTYQNARSTFERERAEYEELVAGGLPRDPEIDAQIEQMEEQLDNMSTSLDLRREELNDWGEVLDETRRRLVDTEAELEEERVRLLGEREELVEEREELELAREELEEEEEALADLRTELEERVYDLEEEILRIQLELWEEQDEIEDHGLGELEILMFEPESVVVIEEFEGDILMLELFILLFLIFFMLAASVVCFLIMRGIVNSDQIVIGVLTSTGYRSGGVLFKYLFYAGSACVLGAVLGYFSGVFLFPHVIGIIYPEIYFVGDIGFISSYVLLSFVFLGVVISTVGMSILACRAYLNQSPAELVQSR